MAGTNAAKAKRAIIDALKALPELEDVQVAYSWPGRIVRREVIYGGGVAGPVALSAMRPAGGRIRREEDPVLQLHIRVDTPGEEDTAAAEERACELGGIVENWLAAHPTLSDVVDGLKLAAVVQIDLDSGTDDEGTEAVLSYAIQLKSYLT